MDLTDGVRELSERVAQLHQALREPAPAPVVGVTARSSSVLRLAGQLVEEVTEVTEVVMNTEADLLAALDAQSLAKDIRTRVDALLQKLLSEAGDCFARFLGLFGEAPSLDAFTTPFSLLLPSVASNYDTDLLFARMRLAGPNPLVIQRIEAPDPRFPVTDAQYRAAMGGADDSLSRAGAEGRLYLADYAVFDGLATGTTSGGQKYIEAPLALFAVPPADAADRRLRPVIFTASAQHATVNFPQRTIMSFTPAMPLAAYAPAPTRVEPLLPASTQLAHLPPLQMALLQQVVGFGLGNIYFTRLGAYDAYLREPWFQDPRVSSPLSLFQERLRSTEREIGQRNLSRIPYDTLLPSSIPQSINI